jgi:DNA-directed RNA polymerase specialized sigma24 family protein
MTVPLTLGALRRLGRNLERVRLNQQPDGELLRRFATEQDEDAFAVLVCRHGGLILGICRRVLPDANDADDVFQATFLLLARKAGSLLRPGSVGAWLHAVAYRLALRARADAGRRRAREARAARDSVAPDEPAWELRAALDEELSRLQRQTREEKGQPGVEKQTAVPPTTAPTAGLEKKLDRLLEELEQARRELRDRR